MSGQEYPTCDVRGGRVGFVPPHTEVFIRSCGGCRPHTLAQDVHGQDVMLACSCHFPGMIILLSVTGMGGRVGFSPPRIGWCRAFLRGLPPPHPRRGCPWAECHAGMFLLLSGYDYAASRYGDGWEGV